MQIQILRQKILSAVLKKKKKAELFMKITNYHTPTLKTFNTQSQNQSIETSKTTNSTVLPSFAQSADKQVLVDNKKFEKYQKAQKYVDGLDNKHMPLGAYDLSKLEGIQYGIKVFEGLNIKQVIILVSRLHAICTSRTCSNGCVHCYADAKPFHVKKDDTETITKMSWEDFCSLTEGIKEFADRMHKPVGNLPSFPRKTISPFVDADSMEIVLQDKNGKEYDMIDISKKIEQDLNFHTLFDTSGWTPKNKKLQERAQRYVEYINKQFDEGHQNLIVNISLNPFHKLNSKYVEYINSDPKRAKKFRELYTDRMANVFYTLIPLQNVMVLNRALHSDSSGNELYKRNAQAELIQEIRNKLEEKYKNDPSCTPKSIIDNLDKFDFIVNEIKTNALGATGRLENLLDKNDEDLKESLKLHKLNHAHPKTILTNKTGCIGNVFVDANGRVYATDEYNTVKTDIQLNFKNKNKKTPPVFGLIEGQVKADDLLKNLRDSYLI